MAQNEIPAGTLDIKQTPFEQDKGLLDGLAKPVQSSDESEHPKEVGKKSETVSVKLTTEKNVEAGPSVSALRRPPPKNFLSTDNKPTPDDDLGIQPVPAENTKVNAHHPSSVKSGTNDSVDPRIFEKYVEAFILDFHDRGATPRLSDESGSIESRSIYRLLRETNGGPDAIMLGLQVPSSDPDFRWIHLPANNMEWVETLILRIWSEKLESQRSAKRLEKELPKSGEKFEDLVAQRDALAQNLLASQRWNGRQYDNLEGSPAARFMKPLYHSARRGDQQRQDAVLFMPYLHWEKFSAHINREAALDKVVFNMDYARFDPGSEHHSPYTSAKWRRQSAFSQMKKRYQYKHGKATDEKGKSKLISSEWKDFQRSTTEAWLIDSYIDFYEKRVRFTEGQDATKSRQVLHVRRTLDRFYYYTMEDSEIRNRDRDQVVYRYTAKELELKDPLLVMVDQLWLWLIDSDTIVTAFPRRWDKDVPDKTDVQRRIKDQIINRAVKVSSAFELGMLIADKCSGVFFPEPGEEDELSNVLDFFAMAISRLANNSVKVFNEFCDDSRRTVGLHNHQPELPRNPPDSVLLSYTNHIKRCHKCSAPDDQHDDKPSSTLRRLWDAIIPSPGRYSPPEYTSGSEERNARPGFMKYLKSLSGSRPETETRAPTVTGQALVQYPGLVEHPEAHAISSGTEEPLGQDPRLVEHPEAIAISSGTEELGTKRRGLIDITLETDYMREIKDILDELNSMKRVFQQQQQLARTISNSKRRSQVNFKQRIIDRLDALTELESKAERVYNALRDLLDLKQKQASVQQAEDTSQQGLTILVFTIITIIFLPLSFVAAIFSMNASEINGQTSRPLSHIWRIMYPVTFGILFFSLLLAFLINPTIHVFTKVKAFLRKTITDLLRTARTQRRPATRGWQWRKPSSDAAKHVAKENKSGDTATTTAAKARVAGALPVDEKSMSRRVGWFRKKQWGKANQSRVVPVERQVVDVEAQEQNIVPALTVASE